MDEGRLTPEEARAHDDRRVLNRAIAPDTLPAPDIAVQHGAPGDRLILTTDGVHGVLPAAVLADLLTSGGTADEVVASVEVAVDDAGAPDNYAIVVVERR